MSECPLEIDYLGSAYGYKILWTVKVGDAVFENCPIGFRYETKPDGFSAYIPILSPFDGIIKKIGTRNGQILKKAGRSFSASFGEKISVGTILPLTNAIAQGDFDPEDASNYLVRLLSPIDAEFNSNGKYFELKGSKNHICVIPQEEFSVVQTFFNSGEFVSKLQPIATIISSKHSARFRQINKKAAAVKEAPKIKEKIRTLRAEAKKLQKASLAQTKKTGNDAKLNAEKLVSQGKLELAKAKKEASQISQRIEKMLDEAKDTVSAAERRAEEIERASACKGEAKAAEIISRLEKDAEEKQASILESARQQRREANELKKSAEAEAKRVLRVAADKVVENTETAKLQAQEAIDLAQAKSDATLKAASEEAASQLQKINDDADKLELAAVAERLYKLMDGGDKAELLQRPQLRTLAFKLNQLVANSQSIAAPETVSLLNTQNKYDEIDAMYDALAQKINAINARENWPDEVKQMAIDALTSSAEVKTGALTDEDLSDD